MLSLSYRLTLLAILILAMALNAASAHERRINTWLVNGPYPAVDGKNFDKDFLGEKKIKPALSKKSSGHEWLLLDDRLYCRNQDDYVDLCTFFLPTRAGAPNGGNKDVVAYLHTYVWSPADQACKLVIGASDGLKAWMNGEEVARLDLAIRQPLRDQHSFDAQLKAGWNRLLIKSINEIQIWGFYAKLADAQGRPLSGLEYSVDAPIGDLAVTTNQMPKGFADWPYLWLTITGVTPNHSVPSASPFRFVARGGQPPYRWEIAEGALSPGLTLDAEEGEILGTCEDKPATHQFTIRVTDAAGATAAAPQRLEVAQRPTKWYEDEKICGLIHGVDKPPLMYGDPKTQAELMAREGYAFAMQTNGYYPGYEKWPGTYRKEGIMDPGKFGFIYTFDDYRKAFEARGIRFGSYLCPRDAMNFFYPGGEKGFQNDPAIYPYWARYNDYQHRYVQEWGTYARPAALYIDYCSFTAPVVDPKVTYTGPYTDPSNLGFDFDPLFSMLKTVSPETLVITNGAGLQAMDWRMGDMDVFSTEGMNDGYNPVWERMPIGQSGHNPKRVPNESWRYPFKHDKWGDFLSNWEEWTRSVVTIICEGHLVNLDHSSGDERFELHRKIGDWMFPRLTTLKGTRPGPVFGAKWGYTVQKDKSIFIHMVKNPFGKTGLRPGVTEITLQPINSNVKAAKLLPSGETLKMKQDGRTLAIDVADINPDPVDTIIGLEME